jgi:hypothetical protein
MRRISDVYAVGGISRESFVAERDDPLGRVAELCAERVDSGEAGVAIVWHLRDDAPTPVCADVRLPPPRCDERGRLVGERAERE